MLNQPNDIVPAIVVGLFAHHEFTHFGRQFLRMTEYTETHLLIDNNSRLREGRLQTTPYHHDCEETDDHRKHNPH